MTGLYWVEKSGIVGVSLCIRSKVGWCVDYSEK